MEIEHTPSLAGGHVRTQLAAETFADSLNALDPLTTAWEQVGEEADTLAEPTPESLITLMFRALRRQFLAPDGPENDNLVHRAACNFLLEHAARLITFTDRNAPERIFGERVLGITLLGQRLPRGGWENTGARLLLHAGTPDVWATWNGSVSFDIEARDDLISTAAEPARAVSEVLAKYIETLCA